MQQFLVIVKAEMKRDIKPAISLIVYMTEEWPLITEEDDI